ncbi:hypothetical protein TNIN_159101 [Trichonephila inaurata madagascariensis]|uniref:Uncharacterized protein n=1 Tax=Trichonephila inaurata madagascariensis TaxID=2747483 RepID=A0A8X6XZB4_9ARAC|nr:hypothetical protein TNIN_159101 [Trichonephila inaurata madagascariensis]
MVLARPMYNKSEYFKQPCTTPLFANIPFKKLSITNLGKEITFKSFHGLKRLDKYKGFHLRRGWSSTSYRHLVRGLKEAVYLSTRHTQGA